MTRAELDVRAELDILDLRLERQLRRIGEPNLFFADADTIPDVADPRAWRTEAEIGERLAELCRARDDRQATSDSGPLARLWALGLTREEVDLLVIAAAPQLGLRYAPLYARLQPSAAGWCSVGLAAELLGIADDPGSLARLCDPGRPLFRRRLAWIAPSGGNPAPRGDRLLHVDDRVADHLAGQGGMDARLSELAVRMAQPQCLADLPLPLALAQDLGAVTEALRGGPVACLMIGPDAGARRAAAAAVCLELGIGLLSVTVPTDQTARRDAVALARREAELDDIGLHLTVPDGRSAEWDDLSWELTGFEEPLFVSCPAAVAAPCLGSAAEQPAVLAFPPLDHSARLGLWRAHVGSRARAADLAAVAGAFELGMDAIALAAGDARRRARMRRGPRARVRRDDLHAAARLQSNHALDRLATRIADRRGWADIVLPDRALGQLRGLCGAVRHRHIVFSDWGFGAGSESGLGISALFTGVSGTGKTMAAGIVAAELDLELYRIDLSTVVSKYIGDTERNLSAIFDAAETSNAILLFDEADALFGKRSEVRDSHDRYANIEVAYLLQRMEEYRGLAILATNLSDNLDDAFARRIAHRIDFPFPDPPRRAAIWRLAFPTAAPLDRAVNLDELARRFELAGGAIRNAALHAGFAAASNGGIIRTEQIVEGVRREFEKQGRLASEADFGPYFTMLAS